MSKRRKFSESSSTVHLQPNLVSSACVVNEPNNNASSEEEYLRDEEGKLNYLIHTKNKVEKELDENMCNLIKVKERMYTLENKVERLILANVCHDSQCRMKKEIKLIKEQKKMVMEELRCLEDKITQKMLKFREC